MELDGVKITVIVDDYAGYDVKGVLGEHGLSLLIEGWREDKKYKVLFDTGQSGHVLLHNAKLLRLNLNDIDLIVLSHRHYDHTGGLLELLKSVKTHIIAHPDILKPQVYVGRESVRLDLGMPYSKAELEKAGGKLLLVKSTLEVAPGIYFLGEIPRVTEYELPWRNLYTITSDGTLVNDEMLDDTGLALNVKGRLIVVGGCSHSGIVNISMYSLKVLNAEPDLVMGGFHLVNADSERIVRTVKDLKSLGFKRVYSGHCTGFDAEREFSLEFKSGFKKLHSGFKVLT